MRKKSLVVVISLIGLALIIFSNRLFPDKLTSNTEIIMTDEGFYPLKVVVPIGTTLRWVNRGERPHWPASNFHPTHTFYPEGGGCLGSTLDACRGLAKGEVFSFTINKKGVWPIHDHLFPGFVMVVEVVDQLSARQEADKNILDGSPIPALEFRKLNYGKQTEIIKTMAESDPSEAWAYLKESFIVNGEVVGNAHEFSHIIGHKAFEKFGLDGVKICDDTFAFGCFHGVTEKMLLVEGLKSIKKIEEGCLKVFPPEKSQNYTGCIHGTGHGVFSFEEGDVNRALSSCDNISEGYRQYCYDGVFMENSSSNKAAAFDTKNPWKFCTDLDERYHRNCARYQSQIFLGANKGSSLISAGKECSLGPSVLLRETCFQSLGFYVSQNSLGKAEEIISKCKSMPNKEGFEICVTGAAIESVFQRYAGYPESSKELCLNLTDPREGACLANIERMMR